MCSSPNRKIGFYGGFFGSIREKRRVMPLFLTFLSIRAVKSSLVRGGILLKYGTPQDCESSRLKVGAIHLCIKLPIFVYFRPTTQTLQEIWMLLFRGCGMGLALICALVTFIIGHVPTWLLGCRGHDRSPVCAKPDEVEAEVEVVVVEVKLSVVVAGAMVEDGLGNMHNKW